MSGYNMIPYPEKPKGGGNISIENSKGRIIREVIEICDIHPYEEKIIAYLNEEIIGQEKAKRDVAKMVVSGVLGISPKKGNIGNLFFSGPTGVGKTQIVKSLTKMLFGDEAFFTKISCEQFSEPHTVSSLIGSPNGYIGFKDKSMLDYDTITGPYKNAKKIDSLHKIIYGVHDFSILLFDEIEKAHPDVIQSLLGLLDEGKFTLRNGTKINLQNTLIIFTSNIGEQKSSLETGKNHIGFTNQNYDDVDKKEIVSQEIKKTFSPEFLGRVDGFINFDSLEEKDCKAIIAKELQKLNSHISKYYDGHDITVELNDAVYDYITKNGHSTEKGARELVRYFENFVSVKLSYLFHSDKFKKYFEKDGPIKIIVDLQDENIQFTIESFEKDSLPKTETGIIQKSNSEIALLKSSIPSICGLRATGEVVNLINTYVVYCQVILEYSDIDIKQEVSDIRDKLTKKFGFSPEDLTILKNAAAVRSFRENFDFIHEFSHLSISSNTKDSVFEPYSEKAIYKLVEKIIMQELQNLKKSNNTIKERGFKNKLLLEILPERLLHLLQTDELSIQERKMLNLFVEKVIEKIP